MRMTADADALEFAASVRDLLDRSADSAALRAAWDSDDGRIPGLWKRLAEIGVTGLSVPEEYGGVGLDLTSLVPVFVEAGRAALPEPVLETLAGAELLRRAGGPVAAEWLPRVAEGTAVLALGPGPTGLVAAGEWADLLLLGEGGRVAAVSPADVRLLPRRSVDRGVRLATVVWDPGRGTAVDDADGVAAFDWAAVAVAAELVGLGEAMLEMAVRYAQQREQFGRPIGSFQAIKHQLADCYVALAFARPVVNRGAWSVARDLPSRARDASHAKHAATVAARRAARTALQVHAGIGYTFEHDLHMWMKRTWTLSALWGDAAFHRGRVAAAVLGDTSPPRVP